MKAKCYKGVIGRERDFCNRGDGRCTNLFCVSSFLRENRQKKPRQVAGLRCERGARKSLQPGLLGEEEAMAAYSRIVRISFSSWLRRWVKRAAAEKDYNLNK
jgi:hypothetical protein